MLCCILTLADLEDIQPASTLIDFVQPRHIQLTRHKIETDNT